MKNGTDTTAGTISNNHPDGEIKDRFISTDKKMAFSYSGIVNYGKSTLPSVESWNTNMNIIKDPPKAIMTRVIDRVGDTSEILATLADSGDRYCENINYYARSINPMVAVSYGESNTIANSTSLANGEAFLPYRVVRDGAFRPPIYRQEDLFPLSRLPRNWTTVDARPFAVDFSKRVMNCGTCETTKEVKNNLLHVSCETRKTIAADPQLTAPQTRYMLKDPLAPGTDTNRSCCRVATLQDAPDRIYKSNHPTTSCSSNASALVETPIVFNNIKLKPNHPDTAGCSSNARSLVETPIVLNNIRLKPNHPIAAGCTNPNGAVFDYTIPENDLDRILPKRLPMGAYECKPQMIARIPTDRQFAQLQKVR